MSVKKPQHPIEHTPSPHKLSYFRQPLTEKERRAKGKQQREAVAVSDQAGWQVTRTRQDPIRILKAQAKTRIPQLIPIRHQRMSVSPFAFFRGGAAIMAHDLAKTRYTNIHVQLCGDMHVANFGFFATGEHQLVFGINDFDETHPGSWEWDLKRLAASAVIACESMGTHAGYAEDIVRGIVSAYRENMRQYAQMPYAELAHQYLDDQQLQNHVANFGAGAEKFMAKQLAAARDNTSRSFLKKFTTLHNGRRQIVDHPPLVTHAEIGYFGDPMQEYLDQAIVTYADSLLSDRRQFLKRYTLQDFARKVVGVGSVGTSCWVMYLTGLNDKDPLFLQYKQAQSSVLEPYFEAVRFSHQGRRVVAGQRLLQGAPDFLLGYGQAGDRNYYIRQLRDMKGGISIGPDGVGKKEMPVFAYLFGWALALGHARSGDPAILSGYMGNDDALDDAIVAFSFAYARQNEVDFDTFTRALKQREIP